MSKRFRIAFSFSGDKRSFVEQVAGILAKRFGQDQILYDRYHEAEFARSDLAFHLQNLYHNDTDLVVAILCNNYEKKEWCGLEWYAIYGLIKMQQQQAIMLCRFDPVDGKGLHGLAGFLDLDNRTPEHVATLITERLALNQGYSKNYYDLGAQSGPAKPFTIQPVEQPAFNNSAVRVLLLDDHEVFRAGLRVLLSQSQNVLVVGEAGTLADGVHQTQQLKPDVILMEARLPDGSGADACKEILERLPHTRVVFVTSNLDDDSVLAAVLAGAHGYILKEIDSSTLLEAVHSVAKGQTILDSGVVEKALQWLKQVQISPQDDQVIALKAEGRTDKEIAAALGLNDKTVRKLLPNIFQKLCILRAAEAVTFFPNARTLSKDE